ncbi:uncharacterized protein LOC135338518 isoform X2 [Halichondria panicea]|uniref:uncharacterized protein LOC135338518 isoform X2 n=1 Tax=Halichondria panicea TaxID=6063 RepID=UPI00312B9469
MGTSIRLVQRKMQLTFRQLPSILCRDLLVWNGRPQHFIDGNDLCVHPGGEEGSALFLAISRVSCSFWSSSRQLASWPTRDEMRGGFSVRWASVVSSELIPSVDTPHEAIIVLDALWARDGDFFACLDCTLYRDDRSGVRGCGDHTDNLIVAETVTFFFLESHVFPPEKVYLGGTVSVQIYPETLSLPRLLQLHGLSCMQQNSAR